MNTSAAVTDGANPRASWSYSDPDETPPSNGHVPKLFFNVSQMAKAAGVCRPTLNKYIENGIIVPDGRVGNQLIFDSSSLVGARMKIALRRVKKWRHCKTNL
jgi:hypothetical protein